MSEVRVFCSQRGAERDQPGCSARSRYTSLTISARRGFFPGIGK